MSNESNFDPPREAEQARGGAPGTLRPLVLAIDTATGARSLGVFRGTTPPGPPVQLSLHVSERGAADSSTVLGDVDRVLRAASVGVKEIELFALAVGPGSFTGVRAGLATVKALATTLRRRAAGVPTLHAVAHAAAARAGSVVAMIPAGRGEVFAQHLTLQDGGGVFEHGPPTHVPPAELVESFRTTTGRLTWAGEGAEKYRALIEAAARAEGVEVVEASAAVGASAEEEGGRVWSVAPCAGALAGNVAALALSAYGPTEDFAGENLRALYVRPADARIGGA